MPKGGLFHAVFATPGHTIARILRFHARAAWRYPGLVVGCLLATPLTVLVETILPPLIVSDVLNRLSTGDYQRNQLWTSLAT